PPSPTLFPYTTLFRSGSADSGSITGGALDAQHVSGLVRRVEAHVVPDAAPRVPRPGDQIVDDVRLLVVDPQLVNGRVDHCLLRVDRKSTRLNSSHVEI